MEAMCIVFVFAALVCLGLLSPFLYAAAAVLPMAANLLRRLLLFRPLAAMEPNSFTALVTDRTGNIVWQEDADHPSYYEAYDLARRAFARLRRFEREDAEPSSRREGKENP